MAGTYDVAGRLAEGRPAVDDLARYASACQALGTCGHGLTDRVEHAYASEAGLDLHALDADHAALRAAVAAVRDAQELQDAQVIALGAAWKGAGADAAAEFLRRHSAASAQAVTALSAAAEQVGALRDELWRIVDAKVAAAEEVDARTDGVRGEWRAAAETVTTGVGDRAAASELVDAHVAPFVERDVRAEWVTAMEAASAAIVRCFDTATTAVRSEGAPNFPEPAQSWAAGPAPAPGVGAAAPWTPPPPMAAPTPMAPPPPATALPPMTEPAAAAAMPAPPMPSAGALPDIGSGLPGLSGTSGIGGLGQQLGEMIGGLMPSIGDALGDVPEPGDLEDPLELGEQDDEQDDEEDTEEDATPEEETGEQETDGEETEKQEDTPEAEPQPEPDADEPAAEQESATATADEPVPEPTTPTPAPAAPLAAPAPAAEPATPCEIAADEVPQVGE
ncbi:hypothetical protein AU195_08000 [Mycobacterium sp. IS-1496]|uniref:hypothetical protein n=1 Tax=Mycobacterium sp. IS-1496 TaxID=1772284 RepID=UPI000741780B|nr:hypothetical protein [Mycobacterium sp. IS-1496]KUI33943.1 hypothetical protein AU195_08000 [Mycobacterium sp. IS-1496]